jgi:hypothetical protein
MKKPRSPYESIEPNTALPNPLAIQKTAVSGSAHSACQEQQKQTAPTAFFLNVPAANRR